jgi:hypothetical protein
VTCSGVTPPAARRRRSPGRAAGPLVLVTVIQPKPTARALWHVRPLESAIHRGQPTDYCTTEHRCVATVAAAAVSEWQRRGGARSAFARDLPASALQDSASQHARLTRPKACTARRWYLAPCHQAGRCPVAATPAGGWASGWPRDDAAGAPSTARGAPSGPASAGATDPQTRPRLWPRRAWRTAPAGGPARPRAPGRPASERAGAFHGPLWGPFCLPMARVTHQMPRWPAQRAQK